MIRTARIWESADQQRGFHIQFSTRLFAFGYSLEFKKVLFIFLGCIVLVFYRD